MAAIISTARRKDYSRRERNSRGTIRPHAEAKTRPHLPVRREGATETKDHAHGIRYQIHRTVVYWIRGRRSLPREPHPLHECVARTLGTRCQREDRTRVSSDDRERNGGTETGNSCLKSRISSNTDGSPRFPPFFISGASIQGASPPKS